MVGPEAEAGSPGWNRPTRKPFGKEETIMSKFDTKLSVVSQIEALVAEIGNLSDPDPLEIGDKKIAKADILVVLNAFLDAAKVSGSVHLQWKNAVVDERIKLAAARSLRGMLELYFRAKYGKSSPKLVKLGFKPAKAPVTPVSTKLHGVQLRQATREARHTMGSHQRLSVHGELNVSPASGAGATAPTLPRGDAAPGK
jgi:hypothetical protein